MNFWASFSRKKIGVEEQLDLLDKVVSALATRPGYRSCEEICAATRGIWYSLHRTYLFDPRGSAATFKKAKKIFQSAFEGLRTMPREKLNAEENEILDGMIENIGERVEKLDILGDRKLTHGRRILRLEEVATKPEVQSGGRPETSNHRAVASK